MKLYRHIHHHQMVCRIPLIGSYIQGQGHK